MGLFYRCCCAIGLHDYVPTLWSVEHETAYYAVVGHLPPIYAVCRHCESWKKLR